MDGVFDWTRPNCWSKNEFSALKASNNESTTDFIEGKGETAMEKEKEKEQGRESASQEKERKLIIKIPHVEAEVGTTSDDKNNDKGEPEEEPVTRRSLQGE